MTGKVVPKHVSARVRECLNIAQQLQNLGVYEQCKATLAKPMNDFIKHGTSSSGKYRVDAIDRYIVYQFSNGAESYAALKPALS